jgi:hypothetical protein
VHSAGSMGAFRKLVHPQTLHLRHNDSEFVILETVQDVSFDWLEAQTFVPHTCVLATLTSSHQSEDHDTEHSGFVSVSGPSNFLEYSPQTNALSHN